MFRRTWKTELTRSESRRGLAFFLLYLLVFPKLNSFIQKLLLGDGEVLIAEANVVYYGILFTLTLFIFWEFLWKDFTGLLDWLPENLFAVGVGLLLAGGVYGVMTLIPFPVENPIPLQYAQEFRAAPVPTLALILVLIPVVEETLFRGLVVGKLRAYSPTLAMGFGTIFYAVACVWRYAVDFSDIRYLLFAIVYLPVSAALSWCYHNGGSVWSCVVLHGGLNGVMLFMAQ